MANLLYHHYSSLVYGPQERDTFSLHSYKGEMFRNVSTKIYLVLVSSFQGHACAYQHANIRGCINLENPMYVDIAVQRGNYVRNKILKIRH